MLALTAALTASSCTSDAPRPSSLDPRGAENEPAAVIEGIELPPDAVNRRYAEWPVLVGAERMPPLAAVGVKTSIVEKLIDEELVELEARRQGLPPCPTADAAVRSACIRTLVERLAGADAIVVPDEEVRAYHATHASEFSTREWCEVEEVRGPTREAALAAMQTAIAARMTAAQAGVALPTSAAVRVDLASADAFVREALQQAPRGGSAGPFSRPDGFVVLRMLECGGTVRPFAEVSGEIDRRLRDEMRRTRVAQLIRALRDRAEARNLLEERYRPILDTAAQNPPGAPVRGGGDPLPPTDAQTTVSRVEIVP